MRSAATKWTIGNVLGLLLGMMVFLGISVFMAMLLLQYFKHPTHLWAMATNVFMLFGVLLGVGVAFALLAGVISYLSLNDKLQQAQSYLAQARLHLDEYKQLSRGEERIQQQVYELMRAYDNLAEPAPISEVNHINHLIKQVLSSEFADFEARLFARAVQDDWQAKQLFISAQSQNEENAWQQALQKWRETTFLWQTVLAAAPANLYVGLQKRFLTAQFHQILSLQKWAVFHGTSQQPEYYRQLNALYQPLLLAEKGKDAGLNQLLNQAAYQAGVQFYQEGESLWQQGSQNLAQVRKKWLYAQQAFQQALHTNANDADSATQWGHLLEREARLVAQSDANKLPEARQLWLAAREKYRMALDIDENRAEAAFNWGNTLSDEATALVQTDIHQLSEARFLWQTAREKFKQAIDAQPQFDVAAHNTGMTFNKEGDAVLHIHQNEEEVRALWKQAGEAFQAALDINPERYETANSWGLVLAKEADLLVQLDVINVPEAKRLWQLAQQRFHRALEIEPNLQAAAANWRTILSHENSVLEADGQLALLQATREKIASLQHISEAHAQSLVIGDLAAYVEQVLRPLLAEQNVLQPPEFRPITRSE